MENILTRIPVIYFAEGDRIVAYSPALDLSTCGVNEQQAHQRFTEAVSVFFKELNDMGTLEEVLEECGWRKNRKHGWSPPAFKSYSEEVIRIPLGV